MKVYYTSKQEQSLKEKITNSEKAYECLLHSFDKGTIGCQEQFNVLFLNHSNQPLGIYKASKGGITSTVADIRLILGMALKSLATGLIISHNHPSGNLKPSDEDIRKTRMDVLNMFYDSFDDDLTSIKARPQNLYIIP